MSDWKEYKLDELVEITSSKRIMRSEYQENGIPFFRSKEIIELNSGNEITTELFISKERFLEIKNKFGIPSYGDILLTSVGTLGVPYFVNYKEEFYFKDGNLTWFRKFNNILRSKYLYYWFSSPVGRKALKEITIGSTQPALTITGLKSLTIHLPTLEEQDYIIEILDYLSSKIQLNTQINQTLEQIAQALFKSWFVDFDPVRAKVQALSNGMSLEQAELAAMQAISGKTPEELTALSQTQPDRYAELAETAKAFPCEMVEVDGVEVPKGWTFQYLKDACNIVYGKGLPKTKLTNTGYRVFGANGVIGYYSEFMYKNPQILIGCRGTVGQVTVSTPFSFITNNSLIIEYENSLINRYYLEHYLRTLNLKEISSGSVQPQITIQNMSGVKLLTPNRETLLLYEINVKDIYETIYQNQIENEKLTKVRDLLLPKLLNGEIE